VSDETLRERVLKRSPLRDDLVLTLATDGLYAPIKRRASFITFDVPAAALVAGGLVYYAPSGGAIIRSCHVSPDAGASPWRFGLREIADIAVSAAAGGQRSIPVWPDAPLRGQFEAFQFFGIGDMSGGVAQGTVAYPNLVVMPPNIFVIALVTANLVAEGYVHVEEFLGGDEAL
jgi:hypothetical protein